MKKNIFLIIAIITTLTFSILSFNDIRYLHVMSDVFKVFVPLMLTLGIVATRTILTSNNIYFNNLDK